LQRAGAVPTKQFEIGAWRKGGCMKIAYFCVF